MTETRTPPPAGPAQPDDGDRLGRLLAAGLFVFGQVPGDPRAAQPMGVEGRAPRNAIRFEADRSSPNDL